MLETHQIILPALFALLGTLWIHPKVLKIAIDKNIVDNPDARKLQRRPIPVLGGIAVFWGIVIGLCSSQAISNSTDVFILMAAMLTMLYTGTMDDILDLSPTIRFVIEIAVVCILMYVNNTSIDCFWGVWGIEDIPLWISYPLTVIACVGIINAINLIDGVNGLSSGFSFMSSVLFAIMFYHTCNNVMATIAIAIAGAIIPFFLHNVFGYKTRMFIGDGGTLFIGTIISVFIMDILGHNSFCAKFAQEGLGLIPFCLAVLSIPVFDTVRVMSTRIINKKSPFSPDKTHLHHAFIDLGFSHIGTTICILSLNLLIVASWFVSYKLGATINLQLYIVLALSITFTFLLFSFIQRLIRKNGKGLKRMQCFAKVLNFEKKGFWLLIQKGIDKI